MFDTTFPDNSIKIISIYNYLIIIIIIVVALC